MKPHARLGSWVALAALLGTGCPGNGGGGDDMPPDGDAPVGLTVTWESRPDEIPGDGSSGLRIERAVFRVANLRIVGDAGPLSLAAIVLAWETGVKPASLVVDDAPPGLYSRCIFDLAPMSSTYAFEIAGTVRVDNTTRPFVIRDAASTSISLDYSITLPPGGDVKIPVRVEVDKLVEAVDFAQVPLQSGQYIVEAGPQLTNVRDELARAFGVHL